MKRLDLSAIFMQQVVQRATSCARTAIIALITFISISFGIMAQEASWESGVRKRAADVEQKLIAWRRDIHQHPELGDQEKRTAKVVAEHLQTLGIWMHSR